MKYTIFKSVFYHTLIVIITFMLNSCATTNTNKKSLDPTFNSNDYKQRMGSIWFLKDISDDFKDNVKNVDQEYFVKLLKADLYFSQGNYDDALIYYRNITRRYPISSILYKEFICLEYSKSNLDNDIYIANEKKYIIYNIIKNSPETNAGLMFKIKADLINKDLKNAKVNFDKLINKVTDKRNIILFLAVLLTKEINNSLIDYKSLSNFANYVIDNYFAYPESHLLASVCYALVANNQSLIHELTYIKKSYPNWKVPLYLSIIVLSNTDYFKFIDFLKTLDNDNYDPVIIKKIYLLSLLKYGFYNNATLYLIDQVNNNKITINNYLLLAIVEIKKNNYNLALDYLLKIKNLSNKVEENIVNVLIALIFDEFRNHETASVYYLKAITSNNQEIKNLSLLLLLKDYKKLKKETDFELLLNRVAQLNKLNELDTSLFKANYYIENSEYNKAYNLLYNIYSKYQNNNIYLTNWALVNVLVNKKEVAIEIYKKFLIKNPDDKMINNNLAYLYADSLNNYDLAMYYALKAYKVDPLDSDILDTLGWVYYKKGNYPLAYVYIMSSNATKPTNENSKHLDLVIKALHKVDNDSITTDLKEIYLKDNYFNQVLNKLLSFLLVFEFNDEFN